MEQDFQQKADAALARGELRDAITHLQTGIDAGHDDFSVWMKLAALRRRMGDLADALATINRALDLLPNNFVALLFKGSVQEQLGDHTRAAETYRAAIFHVDEGALSMPPLAAQLNRARDFLARFRSDVEARMPAAPARDPVHRARAARFADNILDRRLVYHQEPTHYRYPGLADVEFFDFAYPELHQRLRDAFPAIRAEFEAAVAHHRERMRPYVDFDSGQPVGQWAELNRSANWNALHLIRYGEVDDELAAMCPRTIAAFRGDERVQVAGLAPNLMYSFLAPHTHIPPHTGVANFRVVLHLPLVVPDGCRFRVGSETRVWAEGQPWIFDDTIEHEAWNDSDQMRVVLIGDLWRPELDEEDRSIVRDLFGAMETQEGRGAL